MARRMEGQPCLRAWAVSGGISDAKSESFEMLHQRLSILQASVAVRTRALRVVAVYLSCQCMTDRAEHVNFWSRRHAKTTENVTSLQRPNH